MQKGYADVLIGLQYGDEGKARVVDMIAPEYNIIARFNGGSNAGHTVENHQGHVALQQIPSGIFYPDKTLYVGSGCVINPLKVVKEMANIESLNVTLKGRLHFSCQAAVVQPHHILIDGIIGKSVGTTRNGIGPCYADRATRMVGERLVNIRLGDLVDDTEEQLKNIRNNYQATLEQYKVQPEEDFEEMMKAFAAAIDILRPFVESDPLFLERKVEQGAKVLFEGAQSAMLDVTKGSVPFVTSSSTVAAAAYVGGDLSPEYHRKTIGIAKALMSRVGYGPFPPEFGGHKSEEYCMTKENGETKYTRAVENQYDLEKLLHSEDDFEIGIALRVLSHEYGTVTSRPRRVGMLDLVQLIHTARLNGVTEIVINKCDLLREFSRTKRNKIPLVTAYNLDGQQIDYLPGSIKSGYKVTPVIEWHSGFEQDISNCRTSNDLPPQMLDFIKHIEELSKLKVTGIGVGPSREQFVNLS